MAISAYGVYYSVYYAVPNLIIAYTAGAPGPHISPPSPAIVERVTAKILRLGQTSPGKDVSVSEEFTIEEVPALLPAFYKTWNEADPALQLRDGKLHISFSWPIKSGVEIVSTLLSYYLGGVSQFDYPQLQSRYLVGNLSFIPEVVGGTMRVTISDVTLNNQRVPELFIRQMNRLINGFIAEIGTHLPHSSEKENDPKHENRIHLKSLTGLQLKKESLLVTVMPQKAPLSLPPTPHATSQP